MQIKLKSLTKVFNIIFLVIIININFSAQQNSDKINNNIQLDKKEYDIKNKLEIRKLNDDCPPLNISIDLINFNSTFPNNTLGKEDKDLIIESIYEAKYFIEGFINICDNEGTIFFNAGKFKEWGIEYWDETINEDGDTAVGLDINNFFIFLIFQL